MSNGAGINDLELRVERLERQRVAEQAEVLAEVRGLRQDIADLRGAISNELVRVYEAVMAAKGGLP